MIYKEGMIFFWNGTSDLFGKLITIYNKKTFGQSDATHCGIIAEVKDTTLLCYESTKSGFIQTTYDKSWFDTSPNIKIKETIEPLTNVKSNCEQYEGIGYGWLDIITIAIGFLTGFKLNLTGKNKIICSEAVNYVIYDSSKEVNIAAEYGIAPDEVTPMHIFMSQQVK
jgi:hypothetical protein